MIENAVARRYAQAFFAIAREKNQLDQLEKELQQVVETINSNSELKILMNHQLVDPRDKKAMVNEVFSGALSETTVNFLNFVIDKYRITYLQEIYEAFVVYANEARNIADAQVRSAAALSDEDLKALEQRLVKVTGKNIRLSNEVDPSLIGGVVVRIGDKVIDGSLFRRLGRLKENLMQIQVKEIGVRN
ncbi:MAG: F0F1 ATP synthase subunit delta [Bacillota bacterium]